MLRKFSTLLIILFVSKRTNSLCIPCPEEGLTFSSYVNCDCPLTKFYDNATKKCVDFYECPPYPGLNLPLVNPFQDLSNFSSPSFNMLPQSLPNNQNIDLPKEVTLLMKAFNKRSRDFHTTLPRLLKPVFGPVMFANQDLLKSCEGNAGCMIRGVFKKKSNYDLIFPKLDTVLDGLLKMFREVLDDLKEMGKEECAQEEDCPFLENILKLNDLLPRNAEEIRDVLQIAKQLGKYFFDDEDAKE